VRLRSLKNKLALLFFAITGLSFAVIYFYVVPQLESNLTAKVTDDLERRARAFAPQLEAAVGANEINVTDLDSLVRDVADKANARVTLFGVQRGNEPGPPLFSITDSRASAEVRVNIGLAQQAARTNRLARGRGRDAGDPVAQVAKPLNAVGRPSTLIALYSRSLQDTTETVSYIRRRVLVASAVALLVALIGGYLVATTLARRVRRLERAAKEVARGEPGHPLPVDSHDELGQLTRTFNDMQKQLARVERARRDFIANASHELRTPIFSLGGFVELLQEEDLDPETRDEFLRTMREQVDRLGKLAVDLLDLSKLDAGSIELHPQETDLAELARAVVGEFKPAVGRHRTELELHLPDSGAEAWCDQDRAAQVMRILVDNALRHTPKGTHITVTANRHNGIAEFRVADTGPGIEPASAERVFERFHTADAASGSGLGLAIARELAENMRGTVELRSGEGRTEFSFALPATAPSSDPA